MRRSSFVVILLALTLAGCSSGLNHPVQEVIAKEGPDQVQHVRVTAHTYWYEPNRVIVKRGMSVDLTVQNGAWFVPHSFGCSGKDAGFDLDLRLGMFHGSKHARFTPTRAGEYAFRCGVDHHAMKGMTGTLVVVEP
jgi:plastocyanin